MNECQAVYRPVNRIWMVTATALFDGHAAANGLGELCWLLLIWVQLSGEPVLQVFERQAPQQFSPFQ